MKMFLILFAVIKLTYSLFNFTIELYGTSSNNLFKLKSDKELSINAFIDTNSGLSSSLPINRIGSYEYFINYTGYVSNFLSIIINTPLISLNEMFMNSTQIKAIKLKSSGENVQFMESTFERCEELISVDLTEFDLSNVVSFKRIFYSSSLSHVEFGKSAIANVENMEKMFSYSGKRNYPNSSLDLSMFVTSKVTNMNELFYESNWAYINLKNFKILIHH